MPRERRRIVFSGHVQGVGFRATCRSLARELGVGGTVRNLADGRVEVIGEGEPGELDRLVAAVEREMDGFIKDVQSEIEPGGDEPLFEFIIRY
jgi:acylphosphatase